MAVDCDVAIVGAGPIGLTTALLLRQLGHSVQIFERHPKRYPQPRAIGMYHQSVRAYMALGLLDRMFESGALYNIRGSVSDIVSFVNGNGQTLAEVPFNGPLSKSGICESYAMHQPTLEEELEKACQERGVQVHRSVEVKSVVDAGHQVEVCLENTNRAESRIAFTDKVNAYFVVGCDGANSVVRKSANIKFEIFEGANSRWLVVDVIPTLPGSTAYQWKDGYNGKQYLDPKRPRTSCPSPGTRRRWEFMVLPHESSELAATDEFIWKLLAEFDCRPDTAMIERRVVYTVAGGWAETFAKGRVSLAGDAAHLAPQFLGQGLNSGLRDAKSLAWRLSFALRNPDSNWPRLKREYSTEQLATTKNFVTAAKGIERLLTVLDPEQAKTRDALIREKPVAHPDLERVGPGMHLRHEKRVAHPCGEPGTLFIQDRVEINGKDGFFDNIVGEGWSLIVNGTVDVLDALTPETRQRYDVFGGHLVHFSGIGEYKDPSGRYGEWFSDSDTQAVLVRPDYYIYGTAKTKDDIEGLVKSALDRMSS